jgi:AhpD family alkylhydroperoxidase
MTDSYPALAKDLSASLRELRKDVPDTLAGFTSLTQGAMKDGAISAKHKELIAMALAVAAHCHGCLAFHAEKLVKLGATRQEVSEAIAVAVQMGGGPSLMYAADALKAFLQFEAAKG